MVNLKRPLNVKLSIFKNKRTSCPEILIKVCSVASKKDILKLQLHDAIYRLRFSSNSLIHILSLSSLYNNVASVQENRGNKSHRVIAALSRYFLNNLNKVLVKYKLYSQLKSLMTHLYLKDSLLLF